MLIYIYNLFLFNVCLHVSMYMCVQVGALKDNEKTEAKRGHAEPDVGAGNRFQFLKKIKTHT